MKLGDDPQFATQLADAIREGEMDDWLELILEAGHHRKRVLRSSGFRRKERSA